MLNRYLVRSLFLSLLFLAACGGDGSGKDDSGTGAGACSEGCDGGLCIDGACVTCDDDSACEAAYGPDQLCVDGACVPGSCRSDGDCAGGQICDGTTRFCRPCVDVTDDLRCGANAACIAGVCTEGACNSTPQCPAPSICLPDNSCGCVDSSTCAGGVCVERACEGCSSDEQCSDALGGAQLCIEGLCVAGVCRASTQCDDGELCCGHACVAQTCCGLGDDEPCSDRPGFACTEAGTCACPGGETLYVASTAGAAGRILRYRLAEGSELGTYFESAQHLTSPIDIDFDRTNGWFVVADQGEHRAVIVADDGHHGSHLTVTSPAGVAVNGDGVLFSMRRSAASNFGRTSDGVFVMQTVPGLSNPTAIASADSGDVFMTALGGALFRIPAGSTTPLSFATGLSTPVGVVIHRDGRIFVANAGNDSVTVVSADGSTQTPFVTSGVDFSPDHGVGMAFDDAGNLYIASFVGDTVHVIDPAGEVTTLLDSSDGLDEPTALYVRCVP